MRRGLLTTAAVLSAGSCSAVAQAHPVTATPQAWSIGGAAFAALQDPPPSVPHYHTGHAFQEPPVLRSSKGRLKQTLVARNGTILVGGVALDAAQTYGVGSTPRGLLGPTLHVQPGDTIDLVLDNRLVQLPEIPTPTTTRDRCPPPRTGVIARTTPRSRPGIRSRRTCTSTACTSRHATTRSATSPTTATTCSPASAPARSHIRFRIPADHDQGDVLVPRPPARPDRRPGLPRPRGDAARRRLAHGPAEALRATSDPPPLAQGHPGGLGRRPLVDPERSRLGQSDDSRRSTAWSSRS